MELTPEMLFDKLVEALAEAKAARKIAEMAADLALQARPVTSDIPAGATDMGSYVPQDPELMERHIEDLTDRALGAMPPTRENARVATTRKLSPFQAWGALGVAEKINGHLTPEENGLNEKLMEEALDGVELKE